MLDRLPEFVDPVVFAERGRELKGMLKISALPRLAEFLTDEDGTVDIELFFHMDGKLACVSGKITSLIWLECRNCLQQFEWQISSEFTLAAISTLDEVELLPDDYEPLLVEAGQIAIKDIIEEELLLSIPDFPRHQGDCEAFSVEQQVLEPVLESKPDNPFSVLANLKNKGD